MFKRFVVLAMVAVLVVGLVPMVSAQDDLSGKTVTLFGSLTDEYEQEQFLASFAAFEEATGIDVVYEGASDFEILIGTRIDAGDPPDIAGFPQPGKMAQFAEHAIDLTTFMDMDYLLDQYNQSWLDMATIDGKLVGIWNRVSVKSLVWYSPEMFDDAGYEVPATWDELIALSDQIVADGGVPWYGPMESGAATGWVGTDWIEDIMLRTTSLENYDKWVTGELRFQSPEVKRAFELMGQIYLNEDYMYGGVDATLDVTFFDSGVPLVDGDVYLVKQGSSMPTWLDEMPSIGPDGDINYFYFPPIDEEYGKPVLVAGDVFAVFNDRPEVRAVAEFMTTGASLEAWIKAGGTLGPHSDIPLDWYPPVDRGVAEILMNADSVRFDGGDLMPGEVGAGTFWQGVVDYLSGEDLDTVLANIDTGWPE